MAKRKSKVTPDSTLINEVISVPTDVAHLVNKDNAESRGKIRLVFNRKVIELAEIFTGEFIFARGLPADPQAVALTNDPISILINQLNRELDANEVVRRARIYYEQQHSQAKRDAMLLALLDANEIDLEPVPYTEDFQPSKVLQQSVFGDALVPSWRSKASDMVLPEPRRNLQSMYEARLKQIFDLVGKAREADPLFEARFYSLVNTALSNMLRFASEETDPDGFQPQPAN